VLKRNWNLFSEDIKEVVTSLPEKNRNNKLTSPHKNEEDEIDNCYLYKNGTFKSYVPKMQSK
jgi:hypothetical protein